VASVRAGTVVDRLRHRVAGGGRAEALRQEVRAQATEDRLHAQRNYDELLLALARLEESIGLLGTQVARLRAELDERLPAG
jgi:uncharacterized small protein (DUF1192 family)